MMIIDILSVRKIISTLVKYLKQALCKQQKAEAAWPHVLGILTGHTFHFFTKVWPELGGSELLKTPKFIEKLLGGKPASNVDGIKADSKSAKPNSNNKRVGKKPRKLGSE